MFPHGSSLTFAWRQNYEHKFIATHPERCLWPFDVVLSKMDVPDDLGFEVPLANLLIKSLDPQNNPAGWQTLQDIATQNHEIMQQIMYIDPKSPPPKSEAKDNGELYVPPLPNNAQLSVELGRKRKENVGRFPSRLYGLVETKIAHDFRTSF